MRIKLIAAIIASLMLGASLPARDLNVAEVLKERASLIAEAVGHYNSDSRWWAGYRHREGLHIEYWSDDQIRYGRPSSSSTITFYNYRPAKVKNAVESEPVQIDSKIIDAASIEVLNKDGNSDQPWGPYTGEFEKTTTRGESFEKGFSQAISDTFTAGNDMSPVKNELTVTLGFDQRTTNSESESQRANRVFSFHGVTPAGSNERIVAWRRVGKMQSEITGTGDWEHSISVGRRAGGHWRGHTRKWDSFARFMRTARGEAPDNWTLGKWFRGRPAEDWLIERLERPLNMPFRQVLEFEEATSIRLRKEEIE